MLRVRAYLNLLIEMWPLLRPTWKVRIRLKGASLGLFRSFRREFTRRLGRRQIEYALVCHLQDGNPHDHGFLREGTRDEIVAAITGAATKVGYKLSPRDWSVTRFTNLGGHITYATKREKVYGAAPARWRVLTTSQRYCPIGFKDGRIYAMKRTLRPEEINPKMLRGFEERLEKRYRRYVDRYGVDPVEIAGS